MGWLVTLVRFLLEESAAPAPLAQTVGVTWMAPVAGAYLAWTGAADGRDWRRLLRRLAVYAFLVRGFVALVGFAATRLHLGTHYDVSGVRAVRFALTGGAHSFADAGWSQLLWLTFLPQLVVWPLFTLVAGLLAAALTVSLRPSGGLPDRTPAQAPAGSNWRAAANR